MTSDKRCPVLIKLYLFFSFVKCRLFHRCYHFSSTDSWARHRAYRDRSGERISSNFSLISASIFTFVIRRFAALPTWSCKKKKNLATGLLISWRSSIMTHDHTTHANVHYIVQLCSQLYKPTTCFWISHSCSIVHRWLVDHWYTHKWLYQRFFRSHSHQHVILAILGDTIEKRSAQEW